MTVQRYCKICGKTFTKEIPYYHCGYSLEDATVWRMQQFGGKFILTEAKIQRYCKKALKYFRESYEGFVMTMTLGYVRFDNMEEMEDD